MLVFKDTSTLVGHFLSSPREREKRDRRDRRIGDERERQEKKKKKKKKKRTRMKVKKQNNILSLKDCFWHGCLCPSQNVPSS